MNTDPKHCLKPPPTPNLFLPNINTTPHPLPQHHHQHNPLPPTTTTFFLTNTINTAPTYHHPLPHQHQHNPSPITTTYHHPLPHNHHQHNHPLPPIIKRNAITCWQRHSWCRPGPLSRCGPAARCRLPGTSPDFWPSHPGPPWRSAL